jgi:hypothetical protein
MGVPRNQGDVHQAAVPPTVLTATIGSRGRIGTFSPSLCRLQERLVDLLRRALKWIGAREVHSRVLFCTPETATSYTVFVMFCIFS